MAECFQALVARYAQRLQRDRFVETADQHVRADPDADRGARTDADIVAGKRAFLHIGGGRHDAPDQNAALIVSDPARRLHPPHRQNLVYLVCDSLGVEVERLSVDIGEHRSSAVVEDGVVRRDEGQGGRDHLVPIAPRVLLCEQPERQMERGA